MRFEPKEYQDRVKDTLSEYLRECAKRRRPDLPYEELRARRGQSVPYFTVPIPGQEYMPYVCLRVPTGGGKTLLACHAAGIVMKEFLHAEKAVVLWLVPSNTILEQTANALGDPQHPYRRALELGVGAVEVLTIEQALRMSRAAVDGQTVVIVSTIQCFRVADTEGRKVYDPQNSAMAEHLVNVPPNRVPELDVGPDGKPANSLVNVLRLHRPIVIMDEAHNANTKLSFAILGKVQPSCIIEFTATPNTIHNPGREMYASNVLHRVSAAELKREAMIKMPIRVETRSSGQWQELLAESIAMREDLDRLAALEGQDTGEYIRPILLIQAESLVHTHELREHLEKNHKIPAKEIIISTSELDELKNIRNILTPDCPVKLIITVQKLREGWDCPFAYVLCSLRHTHSATAIEQIVGRIMRLPKVALKKHPELNCAYVFSVSESLPEVLGELKGALQLNGFTPDEAETIVVPASTGSLPLWNQPRTITLDALTDLDQAQVKTSEPILAGKVIFDAETGTVSIRSPLNNEETNSLVVCFRTDAARKKVLDAVHDVVQQSAQHNTPPEQQMTGYERQETFLVPLLAIRLDAQILPFDKTVLLEHPWRLSDKDATISDRLYPTKAPHGDYGSLDVEETGRIGVQVVGEKPDEDFVGRLHQQILAFGAEQKRKAEDLVQWLDENIEHRDIPVEESGLFLGRVVRGLMTSRGITDMDHLWMDRFRLRDVIESRINYFRATEHKTAFQALLLDDSTLVISDEYKLDFSKIIYEPTEPYKGDFAFKKHYFPPGPGDLGTTGEEFECAVYLDGLYEVKYWIRNISRRSTSFWLQTSTDRAYPDFICLLKDGRVAVVEYKGKDRWDGIDATEKRDIGAVWASRSKGKCLFIMPEGKDLDYIHQRLKKMS